MVRSPRAFDEDRRQRRRQPRHALTERAVDLLARQRLQHAVAVAVLAGRTAHRTGERGAAAKPRDRDRGIGGAAAVDDEKIVRLHLAVGLREFLDAKHLVEHDDAGAEDARVRRASRRGQQKDIVCRPRRSCE